MQLNKYKVGLNIADFQLKLYADTEIKVEIGYKDFLSESEQTDITVHCVAHLPSERFEQQKAVFEAENNEQKFYSIYKTDSGLGFVIYNQQEINTIQQIALLDESFTHWTLYSIPTEDGFFPLLYPMGPIIMHYMTLKTDAVMMHASGTFDGEMGRIFTGFSGAGKSTMSKIWSDANSVIVNDDRLIVRNQGGEFYIHNTPMYYYDVRKKTPLHSVFVISHSSTNKIKKLEGAMAISKTMAYCIQNNFENQFIHNRLDFLSKLTAKVGVYDLGFVPDARVIDFIKSNEKR